MYEKNWMLPSPKKQDKEVEKNDSEAVRNKWSPPHPLPQVQNIIQGSIKRCFTLLKRKP